MTRFQLIKLISKKESSLAPDLLERAVLTFFDVIEKALIQKKHVEIRRFGTFFVKQRSARSARNPKSGEVVLLPPRIYLHFRTSRHLQKAINSF